VHIRRYLRGDAKREEKIAAVSAKLLHTITAILREKNLTYTFLIFNADLTYSADMANSPDWRDRIAETVMRETESPYISSRQIAQIDSLNRPIDVTLYHDRRTIHPTEHFNRLISAQIKKFVFDAEHKDAEFARAEK
jgi:hypothetical protein